MANSDQEKEIKTASVLFSEEYQEKINRFVDRLAILRKRNRTLARYVYLHACAFGLFTKGIPDIHEFQPKRGKQQKVTFPIKQVMDILKISHRQAQAYHQAGLLVETVDTLYYMKLDLMRASIAELSEEKEKKE